jgi:hypothetical protein
MEGLKNPWDQQKHEKKRVGFGFGMRGVSPQCHGFKDLRDRRYGGVTPILYLTHRIFASSQLLLTGLVFKPKCGRRESEGKDCPPEDSVISVPRMHHQNISVSVEAGSSPFFLRSASLWQDNYDTFFMRYDDK